MGVMKAITSILNDCLIIANLVNLIDNVEYDASRKVFIFNSRSPDYGPIVINISDFMHSDWDEDHRDEAFYMVQDIHEVTHLFRLYRNDSVTIMREAKLAYSATDDT